MHLLTLARMGIGAFNISNLDTFELAKLQSPSWRYFVEPRPPRHDRDGAGHQSGARHQDLRPSNIDAFLQGVDLLIDGFDFFVPEIRSRYFSAVANLIFQP